MKVKPRFWVMSAAGVLFVILIFLVWFILQLDPIFSSQGKSELITVQSGESLSQVGSDLASHHVIASSFAFRIDNFLQGSFVIQPGAYEIRQGSSFSHIRSILHGPAIPEVTASPGLTLNEVARSMVGAKGATYANSFVKDATNDITKSPYGQGASLEGLIGDTTYLILPGMTPAQLARDMVKSFDREASSVGLTPTTSVNGLDAYQLITAASIVVKEGYYAFNMPKVARVIFNRLARGGPLQMDSTILYPLGQDGGTVTPAMLRINSPYNTYLYPGLTPTPICTVSKVALRAVLHAPAGTWLYFETVTKGGLLKFSTTYAEQLQAEKLAASRGLG
ncbi:MAG TPA: endolytic transglycosylase MltG [Acidimicrobiales bacterium]|nr:endolytic transglycosylase MltG [Acidimicrobiales bacterium]